MDRKENEDPAIKRICDMGFELGIAKRALAASEGDESRAVESILLGEIW